MKTPVPVILLAFPGLLISPCSLVTESNNIPADTPPPPISTSTPQTLPTTSGLLPNANQIEFALQDTDTLLPADVLEEVGFYGGGAGDVKDCVPVSQPEIFDSYQGATELDVKVVYSFTETITDGYDSSPQDGVNDQYSPATPFHQNFTISLVP